MKVNQTTVTHPRLNPVQLPLVGKCWSNNSATRIFLSCAMMTGISSTRSWVAVIFWLIPRAYLNSYFLAIIHAKRKRLVHAVLILSLLLLCLCAGDEALAQVPPHPPGAICFTRSFWCWAQPPGTPGKPCTCPTPYGPVSGTLG